MIKIALKCIKRGWFVFPLRPGTKDQFYFKEWQNKASNKKNRIKRWWEKWPNANIGIVCGRSGLLVVDIDVKGIHKGYQSLKALIDSHEKFPSTLKVSTPTGGMHYYFLGQGKNTVNFLGGGIDTRGTSGYVLAPGSKVKKGLYTIKDEQLVVAKLPPWLGQLIQKHRTSEASTMDVGLDSSQAIDRAMEYLADEAPPAIEGAGGDHETFKVAAHARDFGISEEQCLELIMEYYNPRCQPPWQLDDMRVKVVNAYQYATNTGAGADNPAADFDDLDDLDSLEYELREEGMPKRKKGKDETKKTREKSIKEIEKKVGTKFTDWIYISGHKIFFNIKNNMELSHLGFEMMFSWMAEGNAKIINRIAKSGKLMRKYINFCYEPKKGRDNDLLFNLWKDSLMKPIKGDIKWFLDHIKYLSRDRCKETGHILDWMAWCIQYPEKKLAFSLLIQSVPGCGKTVIGELLTRIIGEVNVSQPDNSDLESAFNTWMKAKQLCIVQELMVDGKTALANKLKPLITEEKVNINEKNKPVYTISNYTNFLFFTNYIDAAKLDKGDRRYLVILGPKEKLADDYYTNLWNRVKYNNKDIAAVCFYLMKRDLSQFDGQGTTPETSDKQEMREAGMSEVHLFLNDLLLEKVFPFNCPIISKDRVREAVPYQFSRYAQKEANRFIREELQATRLGQVYLPKSKERKCLWTWGNQAKLIANLSAVEQGAIYENAHSKKKIIKEYAEDFDDYPPNVVNNVINIDGSDKIIDI